MKKVMMIFLSMSMFLIADGKKVDIDVVETKDGNTYKGKIVEQRLGMYLTIELSEGGSKIKILESNIDTIKKETIDKKKEGGIGFLGFCAIIIVASMLIG